MARKVRGDDLESLLATFGVEDMDIDEEEEEEEEEEGSETRGRMGEEEGSAGPSGASEPSGSGRPPAIPQSLELGGGVSLGDLDHGGGSIEELTEGIQIVPVSKPEGPSGPAEVGHFRTAL